MKDTGQKTKDRFDTHIDEQKKTPTNTPYKINKVM